MGLLPEVAVVSPLSTGQSETGMRDWVINLMAVIADGTVIKTRRSGLVVANNSRIRVWRRCCCWGIRCLGASAGNLVSTMVLDAPPVEEAGRPEPRPALARRLGEELPPISPSPHSFPNHQKSPARQALPMATPQSHEKRHCLKPFTSSLPPSQKKRCTWGHGSFHP